jgi:hypothetical protein
MITAVSTSGPGGTVTNLVIDKNVSTADSVSFDANFTSAAQIDFTLSVTGSGIYFLGVATGGITNSTSSAFPNFYAFLVSAPTGSTFTEAGFEFNAFSNAALSPPFPNSTEIIYEGPPGLAAGATTFINLGFQITVDSPGTVEIALSPIPEPSTFALGVIGAIGCLAYWARRFRR